MNPRGMKWIAAVIGTAVLFWFWRSRLAFAPVPWPHQSAFYLPGVELFQWPPRWRMHAEAAFVPSYDVANFRTMPGLPVLLGLVSRVVHPDWMSATQVIRLVSL